MVAIDRGDRGMTYEDCGGVYTSKDGESASADDVVVEQRGARLISLDSVLKFEIPVAITKCQFPVQPGARTDGVGGGGLRGRTCLLRV